MELHSKRLLSPRVMAWSSFVLIIPFLLLAFASLMEWGWLGTLDSEIGMDIIEDRNPILTVFFRGITVLGGWMFSILFVAGVALLLLVLFKRWDMALWYSLTVALGSGVLNQFVKFIFQRPRPEIEHLVEQGGYSFPSGHSMGTVIMFGAVVFLVVRLAKNRTIKWAALAVAALLIFLVGLSRIYLGVHFPTDVIGGYSLGTAWLAASIGVYGMWESNRKKSQETIH